MSLRNLTAATAVAVAALSMSAHALDTRCVNERVATFDGSCWNSLGLDEKTAAVLGVWAGGRSRTTGDSLIGDAAWRGTRDWLEVPASTTTADIIDYLNLLYKTPANRSIQWDWAYILATMNARDDDTDDRLSLITFLRDHGSIPTSGEIVGVKAPDTITIKAEQGTFDIHLEGVTSKGLTDGQRRTTIAFLNGLSHGDDKLLALLHKRQFCEKSSNLGVSLAYQTQFFQDGKTLSAIVKIDKYSSLCLDGRNVGVTELDPDGAATFADEVQLNKLLVSSALAFPDEDVDPKWGKAVADARSLKYFAEEAKKR